MTMILRLVIDAIMWKRFTWYLIGLLIGQATANPSSMELFVVAIMLNLIFVCIAVACDKTIQLLREEQDD